MRPAGAQGRSAAAFPQPRSLSAALLETQLLVLGPLTAAVSEANQLQILAVSCLPVSDNLTVATTRSTSEFTIWTQEQWGRLYLSDHQLDSDPSPRDLHLQLRLQASKMPMQGNHGCLQLL